MKAWLGLGLALASLGGCRKPSAARAEPPAVAAASSGAAAAGMTVVSELESSGLRIRTGTLPVAGAVWGFTDIELDARRTRLEIQQAKAGAPLAQLLPSRGLAVVNGGYFEADWSVNPHWDAKFEKLPDHPITRGVQPFEMNDEWYYHMRFRDGMKGVTPILVALPPASSLSRPDGHHSGNPAVRKAVLENKTPQVMAWAAERAGGGRGFGFTGGHDHWNWGDPNFRKLVLNAILWTAGLDVPSTGVESQVSAAELKQNLDPK